MVKTRLLLYFSIFPAYGFAQLPSFASNLLISLGVENATITRFFDIYHNAMNPRSEHQSELTDDNFYTILNTGKEDGNVFTETLPTNTTWIVTFYNREDESRKFLNLTDQVAKNNASSLNMRFAAYNYDSYTVLATKWCVWKVPVVVIATNNLQSLRFFPVRYFNKSPEAIATQLTDAEWWMSNPVWETALAPGGEWEHYLDKIAYLYAALFNALSQIPSFVWLVISGLVANAVLSYLHFGADKKRPNTDENIKKSK